MVLVAVTVVVVVMATLKDDSSKMSVLTGCSGRCSEVFVTVVVAVSATSAASAVGEENPLRCSAGWGSSIVYGGGQLISNLGKIDS